MESRRPYRDIAELLETADRVWWSLTPADWREAFAAHPRIGEKKQDQEDRSRRWSEEEQSGAAGAREAVLADLAEANRIYEERFGYIFIVCATGKSAEEMLALLRARLKNDPETEVRIAAEEQRKITRLRLEKMAAMAAETVTELPSVRTASMTTHGITTHVLDTARGKPAAGVPVLLEIRDGEGWRELGRAATDGDGRARGLLPEGTALVPGTYRITFDTGAYFRGQEAEGFYPEAAVVFEVRDAAQHHHVPLLLSPYGYSTYRGS
jgi:5-hydroxyisourate hydrolase / 2-oxo-4-hydroxy-4-carboxy-5-ureidoimidazoline decarboxylase